MTSSAAFAPRSQLRRQSGFTLTELLVVVAVIGILAAMLLPALAGAKRKANSTKCLNHLRQIELALTMYANDHEGQYPPRRNPPSGWPWALLSYYQNIVVMTCPSDSFTPLNGMKVITSDPTNQLMYRRSFLINGFNDYFKTTLNPDDYAKHKRRQWPYGMRENAIPITSETITFGEKRTGSHHVHMDFDQGKAGNDVEEVAQKRHTSGANYGFADGSVRFLKYGTATYPQNLWAVVDEWRNAGVKAPGIQ
jgi:prepilin-type N-terminal cleavage/methylation domain-containing protein/prepilin-type processing-associated H-X9-DG protein